MVPHPGATSGQSPRAGRTRGTKPMTLRVILSFFYFPLLGPLKSGVNMNTQGSSFLHWRALARRHPSAFLLAAQLASLVLYAAFDELAYGRALLGALGVLVLALTVWVVTRTPAIRWIAWVLA